SRRLHRPGVRGSLATDSLSAQRSQATRSAGPAARTTAPARLNAANENWGSQLPTITAAEVSLLCPADPLESIQGSNDELSKGLRPDASRRRSDDGRPCGRSAAGGVAPAGSLQRSRSVSALRPAARRRVLPAA